MWCSVCLGVRGPRRLFSLCRGYSFSPRHVSLFLVYFSPNDSTTFGHPSPFCFHTLSLCLVFLFTSFSVLCPCVSLVGFVFGHFPFLLRFFPVLISHSFRSTPISFSGPLQFILRSLELLFSPFCKFFLHSLTMFFFVPPLDPAAHILFSFPNVIYFSARCKICFWVSLSP